jgi:hypothetical protein
MKNRIKQGAVLLLALTLLASLLVGCGSKLSGKYSFISIEENGNVLDNSVLESIDWALEFSLEFEGDKFTLTILDDVFTGTYELKGSELTLTTTANEELTGTVDGDKITITVGASKVVFEKEK